MVLRTFNGVSAILKDEDSQQPLDLLMLSSFKVYAGDANLWGGGGLYGEEYWSREFPHFLKSSEIPVHIKEFYVLIVSWDGCSRVGDVEGRTRQHLIVAVVARARGGHIVSPAGDGQGWAHGGHDAGVTVLLYN